MKGNPAAYGFSKATHRLIYVYRGHHAGTLMQMTIEEAGKAVAGKWGVEMTSRQRPHKDFTPHGEADRFGADYLDRQMRGRGATPPAIERAALSDRDRAQLAAALPSPAKRGRKPKDGTK